MTSANLYNNNRDDLVLFYFRHGAEYASVYTQSNVISENIKWNLSIKSKKIKALIVNARNANCLTGLKGYNSLREIAEETARLLTNKQKMDEEVRGYNQPDFLNNARKECLELGFKNNTEKFGECVLQLSK